MIALLLAAAAAAPDRSRPPEVVPPTPLPLAEPEVHALGPGATAWHVRVPSVRKVSIHAVWDGGMVELHGGPTESARAMGWLLDVAAGRRGARRFALDADLNEVEISSGIGLHEVSVSTSVPLAELPIALDMLHDVVHAPRFPRSATKRYLRDVSLFYTVEAPASLGSTARLGAAHAWFAADHPYGARRRLDLLSTVRRGDLVRSWERLRTAVPVTVLVVGDVAWSEVSEALTRTFGSLGASGPGAVGLAVDAPAPRVVAVDMPGQEQVAVRLRTAAPPTHHPEHVAMWATQWALGGHILSRLSLILREEKDYTYGAGARYQHGPRWGTLTVSVDVAAENVADTITVIRDQLAAVAAEGLTDEEINGVHRSALLDWNTTLQSASVASGHYLESLEHGWRSSEMLERMSQLALLTPEAGARVARGWLSEEAHRVWVLVGDRSALEPQLQTLGLNAEWITPAQSVLGDF